MNHSQRIAVIEHKVRDQRNIICLLISLSISSTSIHLKDFAPIDEFKVRNRILYALIRKVISSLRNSPLPTILDPAPYSDRSWSY